uniref:Uncharacterized protein n=1 Tax=Ciona savignyi TaxID=51511 RepID=H2Z4E7_CIOSA
MEKNIAAQYGMVTAAYFGLFMYRYNKGYVHTGKRAIINIMVLFVVVQPLCRIIGGSNGLFMFAGMCMSSIIMLPTPQDERREWEREQEKKAVVKSKKHKTKTKTS